MCNFGLNFVNLTWQYAIQNCPFDTFNFRYNSKEVEEISRENQSWMKIRLTAPSKTISSYCGYFFQPSSKGARLFFKEGTYTFAKMESGSKYEYNN